MYDKLMARFPKVEALITDLICEGAHLTTDAAVEAIREVYDREGPYEYAKRFGLLVDGSGEEFAIEWMSFYNEYAGRSVY
jgi:folate-binding Fe-S cluster repair protein YgfZ